MKTNKKMFACYLKSTVFNASYLSYDEIIESFEVVIKESEKSSFFKPIVFKKIRDVFIREYNLEKESKERTDEQKFHDDVYSLKEK